MLQAGGVMAGGGHRNEYQVDGGVELLPFFFFFFFFFFFNVSEGWFICERS